MVCLNRVQSSRRLEREAGTYARLVSNLILRTLGLLTIAPDVSAKLALTTIASLTVLGALQEVRKRSCRGQPRHFFFDISEQIFGGVKSNSHWRKIEKCY